MRADADPVVVAALREVLDLGDDVPWWTSAAPNVGAQPSIGIVLRSTLTFRGQVDAITDPAWRARKLEELAAYVSNPDAYEEIPWTVTLPHHSSSFFRAMTLDDWLGWEAAKMPAHTLPVRLGRSAQIAHDLRSTQDRDETIRQALADGTSVAELVTLTGLSRPRIYQIRDGK